MLARTACLAALVVSGTAAADRPESNATLVGTAVFSAQPDAEHGTVKMVVYGIGHIDTGDCPEAGRNTPFTATYEGEIDVDADGKFTAPLYPADPVIVTRSGCAVTDLDVVRIIETLVEARLGSLDGNGWLTFQNFAAVDVDSLLKGSFNNVKAELRFAPEVPCNSGL